VARSLIFQVPNDPQGRGYIIQALLINANHLPRRFAQLKLVAHFPEAGSKSFNLLLLPGYRRFLLLDLRCSLRNSFRSIAFSQLGSLGLARKSG